MNYICLLIFSAFIVHSHGYQSFSQYSLIKIAPENEQQLELLHNISNNEELLIKYGLDFWSHPMSLDRTVDVLLPPDTKDQVDQLFDSLDIKYSVAIPDIQP